MAYLDGWKLSAEQMMVVLGNFLAMLMAMSTRKAFPSEISAFLGLKRRGRMTPTLR